MNGVSLGSYYGPFVKMVCCQTAQNGLPNAINTEDWELIIFYQFFNIFRQIYWVDTYLDFIERVDYNGLNRKTILKGSPAQNLYSAAVFENTLYVTSWRNNSILSVNKFHPGNFSTILDDLKRPFALKVFHRQRQPIGNVSDVDSKHPCMNQTLCQHVSYNKTCFKHLFILRNE